MAAGWVSQWDHVQGWGKNNSVWPKYRKKLDTGSATPALSTQRAVVLNTCRLYFPKQETTRVHVTDTAAAWRLEHSRMNVSPTCCWHNTWARCPTLLLGSDVKLAARHVGACSVEPPCVGWWMLCVNNIFQDGLTFSTDHLRNRKSQIVQKHRLQMYLTSHYLGLHWLQYYFIWCE